MRGKSASPILRHQMGIAASLVVVEASRLLSRYSGKERSFTFEVVYPRGLRGYHV